MTVDILDPATLQRLPSLEFPWESSVYPEALVFSPDGRMLASFVRNNNQGTEGSVVSWDLQTGGVVSATPWKGSRGAKVGNAHITYSTNGRIIAALSRHRYSTVISIYDVLSGMYMCNVDYRARTNLSLGASYVYKIWAHGESLRFATPEPTAITIWEVELNPGATPTEVETVSVPDNTIETFAFDPKKQSDVTSTEFHHATCRLAFIGTGGALLVWDARVSGFLLHHTDTDFNPLMTFSSDGRSGYTLSEKLTPGTRFPKPLYSPNGKSIIVVMMNTEQRLSMISSENERNS